MTNPIVQESLHYILEGLEDIYRKREPKDVVLFGRLDQTFTARHAAALAASLVTKPVEEQGLSLVAHSCNLEAGRSLSPLGYLSVQATSELGRDVLRVSYATSTDGIQFIAGYSRDTPYALIREDKEIYCQRETILAALEQLVASK